MRNRRLMFAVVAASAAAAVGIGSMYAAAMNGLGNMTASIGLGSITAMIGETETEETETETEPDRREDEPDTPDTPSILDIFSGAEQKNVLMEEEMAASDGLMMSAAEIDGGAYYAEPAMPNWNTEQYSTVDETGFKDVKLYPLSTFGMDVDTASYALLRRNTLDGTLDWMPKDAVRIEEMINYFNYRYTAPGDGETFSISAQIAPCPWNEDTKLMLVGLQARDIPQEEIRDQNLVFLVDTSGSMYDQDKLPLAVSALKYLMQEMDERDSVAIVTYAGYSKVALEPTKCTEEGKNKIAAVLDSLRADGGTYGEGGIRTAYDLAAESYVEGGNNRVLLLTDGDFNLGQTDDSELVDLVTEKAEGKIFLSILGFGAGNYNDALAEQLADKGNGNYSYIDSDMEARRVMGAALKGTLNTVAKDAKVQVDFNPAYIRGYRLIGYENRAMDAEDFEDDKKDGGEVGAGQQVTVLYELVTADSGMEIPAAHSRYTQEEKSETNSQIDETGNDSEGDKVSLAIAGSETEEAVLAPVPGDEIPELTAPSENEYLTVSIRYKDPEAEESRLMELAVTSENETAEMSDNMSWAAGVAQTGMLLRGSEYAGTSDYDEVHSRLQSLTGGDEFREEFVYLISRLKGVRLSGMDDPEDGYNEYEEYDVCDIE